MRSVIGRAARRGASCEGGATAQVAFIDPLSRGEFYKMAANSRVGFLNYVAVLRRKDAFNSSWRAFTTFRWVKQYVSSNDFHFQCAFVAVSNVCDKKYISCNSSVIDIFLYLIIVKPCHQMLLTSKVIYIIDKEN